MTATIAAAERLATIVHTGQLRRYVGGPYIAHPTRVVALLRELVPMATEDMISAAWLHDVVEDTAVRQESINEIFGDAVGALVWQLTKPNPLQSIGAMLIKACDIIDNLSDLADVAPADEAKAYLAKKALQVIHISATLSERGYPAVVASLDRVWLQQYNQVMALKSV